MKHLLILIFCFFFLHAAAQRTYAPNPRAQAIHDRAINTYISNKRNKDSVAAVIRIMDNVLAIDSNYLIAWNNKLSFECQLKQYDNALRTVKKMISIFPEETDFLFFSGVLALKAGHNEEATSTLELLIKKYDQTDNNADNPKTNILNKGLALKLLGRTDESRQLLVNQSMKEPDLTVRRHINAYLSKSKEEIINEMISARYTD